MESPLDHCNEQCELRTPETNNPGEKRYDRTPCNSQMFNYVPTQVELNLSHVYQTNIKLKHMH